jgi:hypothetical protein
MKTKRKPPDKPRAAKPDDPEQSKRFVETAREIGRTRPAKRFGAHLRRSFRRKRHSCAFLHFFGVRFDSDIFSARILMKTEMWVIALLA